MEVSLLAGQGGAERVTTALNKHLHGQSGTGSRQAGGFNPNAGTMCHSGGPSGAERSHPELLAQFGNRHHSPDLAESTCAARRHHDPQVRSMSRTGSQTGKWAQHSPDWEIIRCCPRATFSIKLNYFSRGRTSNGKTRLAVSSVAKRRTSVMLKETALSLTHIIGWEHFQDNESAYTMYQIFSKNALHHKIPQNDTTHNSLQADESLLHLPFQNKWSSWFIDCFINTVSLFYDLLLH